MGGVYSAPLSTLRVEANGDTEATEADRSRLRIAIATSPNSDAGSPSLAHEVRLVRASVLYADEVELVSPGAEMLVSMAALASGDERNLLDFFMGLDDSTITALGADTSLPSNWREIVKIMSVLTDEHWDLISQITGQPMPEGGLRDTASSAYTPGSILSSPNAESGHRVRVATAGEAAILGP